MTAVATDADSPVLEARHIHRNFGAVVALADASITLAACYKSAAGRALSARESSLLDAAVA